MAALFVGSERGHGRRSLTGKSETVAGPATVADFLGHLQGRLGVGVIPLLEDGKCTWGAIDIDGFQGTHAGVAQDASDLGIPLWVFRSKSGDAHLIGIWEAVEAWEARSALKAWAKKLGHPDAEIFPKQSRVGDLVVDADGHLTGLGNWLNMPFFEAKDTRRVCVLPEGRELGLDEWLDAAEAGRTTAQELRLWVEDEHEERATNGPRTGQAERAGGPMGLADNPWGELPCVPTMKAGVGAGHRNVVGFKLARHWRRQGMDGEALRLLMLNWAGKCTPPLTDREVDTIVQQVGRGYGGLGCEDPIIRANYCAGEICPIFRKKEHQTDDIKAAIVETPSKWEFNQLVKVDTDPPTYRVTINGQEIQIDIDDLASFARFRKQIIAKLDFGPDLPIVKGKHLSQVWNEMINGWLAELVVEAAPDVASAEGLLQVTITEWLRNGRSGTDRTALLSGQRWVDDDGTVYFTAQSLRNYLHTRLDTVPEQHKLYTTLRRMGVGGPTNLRVGKTVVKAWLMSMPSDEAPEGEGEQFQQGELAGV